MSAVIRYFGAASGLAHSEWVAELQHKIAQVSPFAVTVIVSRPPLKAEIARHLSGTFPRIVTLTEFTSELADQTPLSTAQQLVMFNTLVAQRWPDLFNDHSKALSRGIVEQLFALFRQLPEFSLSPDDLVLPSFRKISGFALLPELFKAFRHHLDEVGGDELTFISQLSAKALPELAHQHLFWVGFFELPIYQRRWVRYLMQSATSSTWLMDWEDTKMCRAATSLWNWLTPMVTEERGPFSSRAADSESGYFITHYSGVNAEITSIFRQIRYRVEVENRSPYTMGIVIPKADPYTDLAVARAREFGIPISFKTSEGLKRQSVYGTLTEFIDLLTLPWQIDRVIRLCHSPFITIFKSGDRDMVIDGDALAHLNRHLVQSETWSLWVAQAESRRTVAPNPIVRDRWTQAIQLVKCISDWATQTIGQFSPAQFGTVLADISARFEIQFDDAIVAAFSSIESISTLMPVAWESAATSLKLVLDSIRVSSDQESPDGVIIVTPENSIGIQRDFWWVCGFQEGNWPAPTPEDWLVPQSIQKLAFPNDDHSDPLRYALWGLRRDSGTWIQFSTAPERHNTEVLMASIGSSFEPKTFDHSPGQLASERESAIGTLARDPIALQVESSPLKTQLGQKLPHFSATAFDTLADCRHRFFLRDIAKLYPELDREREIETIQWGNLIHEIIADVLTHLIENPADSLTNLVTRYAKQRWQTLQDPHPFWQLKYRQLFGTDTEPAITHIITGFLGDILDNWTPIKVEWPFRFKPSPEGCEIVGKVDAIFQHRQFAVLAILDFKTGKSIPERAEIAQFKRFQLPIYAMAVQDQFPNYDIGPVGYLHLHSPAKCGFAVRLISPMAKTNKLTFGKSQPIETNPAFWDGIRNAIHDLAKLALSGNSSYPPVSEQPKTCEYCAYIQICRAPNRYGNASQ